MTNTTATEEPALPTENKPNVKSRVARVLPITLACIASFVVGLVCTRLISGNSPSETESPRAAVSPIPKYVAALARRSEPIAPVVPIAGLDVEVIKLGEKLFHDLSLSPSSRIACASCHDVRSGGDDGLQFSIGFKQPQAGFNSPSVLNSSLNFLHSWEGHKRTLEEQVTDCLLDEARMGSNWERIEKLLSSQPMYSSAFRAHLGGAPNPERVQAAISTYTRSLLPIDSRFDRWLAGEESALSTEELSGYYSFLKFNCIACHSGENVGGHLVQPLGAMEDYFASTRELSKNDLGLFNHTGEDKDRHVFRVPALRNVGETAPHFHDGSAATLEDAVSVMIRYQVGEEPNAEEVRRIALFLRTLTGKTPGVASNDSAACPL